MTYFASCRARDRLRTCVNELGYNEQIYTNNFVRMSLGRSIRQTLLVNEWCKQRYEATIDNDPKRRHSILRDDRQM